ncbi:lipopolysaccharide biosynthesis protein [Blautia sp.]|uniref:lipopolysaccharide biosynthesis protein n=1 Tax=Blautia sp. TaxID=1955243 RepID=UPI003AB42DB7
MKLERGIKNIIFSFSTQIITIALGLIVPRLILVNYGSEINGFFSTVSNIYTYLSVLEAGVGTAAIQALYGPVVRNNRDEINGILSATRKLYRRCAKMYLIAVGVLSLVLPFTLNTTINSATIIGYVFLQGLITVINFYMLSTLSVLLSAEGKNYIKSNIALLSTILTNIAKIILVNAKVNIVFLQVAYLSISLIVLGIYLLYFKKNYKWINLNVAPRASNIKQQKYYLIHQISFIVFNNIDTVIISIFCGLSMASVYAIYNMVFSYVGTLFNTVFISLNFTLGQTYNEDKSRYPRFHDAYKTYFCAVLFALVSVCYLLIIPFIQMYTAGISDVVYIDKYLPFLFCMIQLLSGSRSQEADLINIDRKAKETMWRTIAEAGINLILSLILVQFWGLYGVLIATIVAMLYRTNDILFYANRIILKRWPVQAYKIVFVDFSVFFGVVWIKRFINIPINNYYEFFFWGIILTLIAVVVYVVINSMISYTSFCYIREAIIPRVAGKFKRGV